MKIERVFRACLIENMTICQEQAKSNEASEIFGGFQM